MAIVCDIATQCKFLFRDSIESRKKDFGELHQRHAHSHSDYTPLSSHTHAHTSSTNTACHRIWWNLRICVLPVRCAYREKKSVPEQVQSSWTSKFDVCATLMFAIFLAHQSGCAFAEAQTRSQRSRNSVRDSKSERFLPASFMSTLKFSYLRSSKEIKTKGCKIQDTNSKQYIHQIFMDRHLKWLSKLAYAWWLFQTWFEPGILDYTIYTHTASNSGILWTGRMYIT